MTANAEKLRLGDAIYIWRKGRLCDAQGRDVPLRAKSLDMFSALLAQRGEVLSKDRLSELVWPETAATDESIARCVADIRKALKDERHDIVQTYPKRGYRLNVGRSNGERLHQGFRTDRLALAFVALIALLAVVLTTTGWTTRASDEVMAVSSSPQLQDTVAILPFRAEADQDGFLASGLSDDLEIHLAELSGLRILSSAQTGATSKPPMTPANVARSLNARYIVQGTLRRSDDRIAVSIQLIDGSDGATLWADRYEGPRDGLIEFRDTVPEALVKAMSLELSERDLTRLALQDTDDPIAFEHVMRARRALSQFTYEGNLGAERLLRQAIQIDPEYARAYAELASAFAIRLENDWTVLSPADTQKAFYFAERALAIDPDLWFGHYGLGRLHSITPTGDTDAALNHLRTAMELQPANDDARAYYGIVLMMSGEVTQARTILEDVIAGHPNPPFWYYLGLANALFHLKDYDTALDAIGRCLSQMPNSPYCLRTRIAVEARLGRLTDAEWTIEEYAILGHDTSLAAVMNSAIERDQSMLGHLRQSYRMAGLK